MRNFIWSMVVVSLLAVMACDAPKAENAKQDTNPRIIKLDNDYSIVRLKYNGGNYTFLKYEHYTSGGNYGVTLAPLDYESSGLGEYKP